MSEYLERQDWYRWLDNDYKDHQQEVSARLTRQDEQIIGLVLAGAKMQAGAEAVERLTKSVWVRIGVVAALLAPPTTLLSIVLTYWLTHHAAP